MKKSTVIGIIAFMTTIIGLISSPVAVQAYQALTSTPTKQPTITAPPPYNPMINTPANLGDLDCPENGENPTGWGTVTPSSGWMMLCSQCVSSSEWGTSTPSNTKTPNPTFAAYTQAACQTAAVGGEPCLTQTPISTGTPYPTNTPGSITPTIQASSPIVWIGNSCDNSRLSDNGYFVDCEIVTPNLLVYTANQPLLPYDFNYMAAVIDVLGRAEDIEFTIYATFVNHGLTDVNYQGYHLYSSRIAYTELGDAYKIDGVVTSSIDGILWGTQGLEIQFTSKFLPNAWGNRNYTAYLSINAPYDPFSTPTPTPIMTATPGTGYCQSVSSTESGFSWSGITIGETQCFDIGPYEFDFWGLMQPEEEPLFTMPWIAHVCAQDISFGEITVFDVVISLETILYILMFAAVIRNMFVS